VDTTRAGLDEEYMSEQFYQLYRKLAETRQESSKGLAVLDELAKTCHDRKMAMSLLARLA